MFLCAIRNIKRDSYKKERERERERERKSETGNSRYFTFLSTFSHSDHFILVQCVGGGSKRWISSKMEESETESEKGREEKR